MKKKLLPLLFTVVTLLVCIPATDYLARLYRSGSVSAGGDYGIALTIEKDGNRYVLNRWKGEKTAENECYIVIPAALKGRKHTLTLTDESFVTINGETFKNGRSPDNITEGLNTLCMGEKEYSLYIYYTDSVPCLYITTESGNLEYIRSSRNNKEAATARILSSDSTLYSGNLEHIKGRGNTSWLSNHPGFNIKFDKKVNLFNMGAAKKWSLLTPYKDSSLVKNQLAYRMSRALKMEYTPQQQHINLFINGEYRGVYFLTESVEIAQNRIPVFNLETLIDGSNENVDKTQLPSESSTVDNRYNYGSRKWVNFPENPPVVNGGYVLEYELPTRYSGEKCGFISEYGQHIIIKQPGYVSKEQIDIIADYYQDFEDSVRSPDGYNSKGKHYSEYIDVDSMASAYIVQELSKNIDACGTSFFLYKDVNEKMKAGPVWDFDIAFGYYMSRYGISMNDPYGRWVYNLNIDEEATKTEVKTILSLLCAHKDFMDVVKYRWDNMLLPRIDGMTADVDSTADYLEKTMFLNRLRWNDTEDYSRAVEGYKGRTDAVKHFVTERRKFLTEFFTEKCAG